MYILLVKIFCILILLKLHPKGEFTLKEYQHLIGHIVIAIAIVVAAFVIGEAIVHAGNTFFVP